ncbi:MAG: hypothetical protein ACRC5H_08740 [Treponemataceae bacterium]
MKQFIVCVCLFVASALFSQEEVLTTAIVEKTDHYTITIEFTPLSNEGRVYFVSPQRRYEEGLALNKIKDRLDRFMKETREEYGYYHYRMMRPSETKHDAKKKETTFIEHVLFTKE